MEPKKKLYPRVLSVCLCLHHPLNSSWKHFCLVKPETEVYWRKRCQSFWLIVVQCCSTYLTDLCHTQITPAIGNSIEVPEVELRTQPKLLMCWNPLHLQMFRQKLGPEKGVLERFCGWWNLGKAFNVFSLLCVYVVYMLCRSDADTDSHTCAI